MGIKNFSVSHYGEVSPANFLPTDDLTSEELIEGTCRVLRLSNDNLIQQLADKFEARWRSPASDVQPLIRSHIALILGIIRGIHFTLQDNMLDYALLAFAQGTDGREFLGLLPKWEERRKKGDKDGNN